MVTKLSKAKEAAKLVRKVLGRITVKQANTYNSKTD
jgi:hypothetical protein